MPATVVFIAYGVTVEVVLEDAGLVPDMIQSLPHGWEAADVIAVTTRFRLARDGTVWRDGDRLKAVPGQRNGLAVLESGLRAAVALHAPEHVFIHAGVVAVEGKAIVVPGQSFSGKTTLVAALVRAGAAYGSDEFAVLDPAGAVHPYPKPLSMRMPGDAAQVDVPVEAFGGAAVQATLDVRLIVSAPYDPATADWAPESASAGAGALALLEHAVAARHRSAAVLRAVARAAGGAVFLRGRRGEADVTARRLLSIVGQLPDMRGTHPGCHGPDARGA